MTHEERRRILAVVEERIVVLERNKQRFPLTTRYEAALYECRELLQELRRVTEEMTR